MAFKVNKVLEKGFVEGVFEDGDAPPENLLQSILWKGFAKKCTWPNFDIKSKQWYEIYRSKESGLDLEIVGQFCYSQKKLHIIINLETYSCEEAEEMLNLMYHDTVLKKWNPLYEKAVNELLSFP